MNNELNLYSNLYKKETVNSNWSVRKLKRQVEIVMEEGANNEEI